MLTVANPGSPRKNAVKTECMCVCVCVLVMLTEAIIDW